MTAEFTSRPGLRLAAGGGGAPGLDGVPVLEVRGEVDLANARELDEAIGRTAGAGGPVAVDLSGVGYLDSAAVRVLFEHAVARELHLLVAARGVVVPVVAVSGLAEVATVHRRAG